MRHSKSLAILIAYVFAMFFLPLISGYILKNHIAITESSSLQVYANLISYIFLTFICLTLFGSNLLEDFKKIPSFGHYVKGVVFGWVLLLAALIISNILLFFLLGSKESSANQQTIVSILEVHPLLMAITTVLLAPLVEEIIFRLTLMKDSILPPWAGILLSSLLFGLIHVIAAGDFIFIIPYMAMGIPLGYTYHKNRNICYPIGIHLMQNLFATLMITVPVFFL